MSRIVELRQQLARQLRADICRVLREDGDTILDAVRADKSVTPTELKHLTNLLATLRSAK